MYERHIWVIRPGTVCLTHNPGPVFAAPLNFICDCSQSRAGFNKESFIYGYCQIRLPYSHPYTRPPYPPQYLYTIYHLPAPNHVLGLIRKASSMATAKYGYPHPHTRPNTYILYHLPAPKYGYPHPHTHPNTYILYHLPAPKYGYPHPHTHPNTYILYHLPE